jgi:hypothetical protein
MSNDERESIPIYSSKLYPIALPANMIQLTKEHGQYKKKHLRNAFPFITLFLYE